MGEMFKIEFLSELLSEAAKTDLVEKLFVFAIAWFFIRRTISGHFDRIEKGLGHVTQGLVKVATNVSELKGALTAVEKNHSMRLGHLEENVSEIKGRVKILEKNKGE